MRLGLLTIKRIEFTGCELSLAANGMNLAPNELSFLFYNLKTGFNELKTASNDMRLAPNELSFLIDNLKTELSEMSLE